MILSKEMDDRVKPGHDESIFHWRISRHSVPLDPA